MVGLRRDGRQGVRAWGLVMAAGAGCVLIAAPVAWAQVPGVEHVLLIGVDGLSPAGIDAAPTPVMDALIRGGARTFTARAVFPTSSSSNWASMVTGAGTEQHGITANDWQRTDRAIRPADTGLEPIFPTIFGELRRQRPSATIHVIYQWGDFGRLYERSAADLDRPAPTQQVAAEVAAESLKTAKPTLTFVHLDHVDGAGHRFGWETPPYLSAVAEADALIGQMLAALDAAGMRDSTLVIITSDHGGINKGHGGETMQELEIPWIIAGPGVAAGREITRSVNTTDTAATIAHALGFRLSDAAIGRAVVEAFDSVPDGPRVGRRRAYLPAPAIVPPTTRTTEERVIVRLMDESEIGAALRRGRDGTEAGNAATTAPAEIRYTLDGSEPTRESPRYAGPIELERSATIRARAFGEGGAESRAAEASYRLVRMVPGHGLSYTAFLGKFDKLPDLSEATTLKPERSGVLGDVDLSDFNIGTDEFALRIEGTITIDTPGEYTFSLASDDGSRLLVSGKEVVANDGKHGTITRAGKATLAAGEVPITILYFNGGGAADLSLMYAGPGIEKQHVPIEKLTPKK